MGSVNGYTAERMKAIEDASVVNGEIDPITGHLKLTRFDESEIDAGVITQNPLRDTSAHLASTNPVVDAGRIAIATDSNPLQFALGDGVTAWNLLPKFERKTGWTTYTPTVIGTTNPNLGSTGTKQGRWYKSGPITFFEIEAVWGGTGITAGAGNYTFGLPHNGVSMTNPYGIMAARGKAFDSSANIFREYSAHYNAAAPGTCYLDSPVTYPTGASSILGAGVPWVWAAGDSVKIAGWFANA